MTKREKSTFVLDTNVVLHDHQCLDHFQEHDVVIPITVLEELDSFKKGNDSINFSARSFIRQLDSLADGGLPAAPLCRLEAGHQCGEHGLDDEPGNGRPIGAHHRTVRSL